MKYLFISGWWLVSAFFCVLAGCARQQPAMPPMQAVPITVATAVKKSVPVQVQAIGTVEALRSVSVKALVAGELLRVHFREGQEVKKDSLLFEIDPRPYDQAVRQAEAQLARDVALVSQWQANLAKDQAASQNAQTQATRYTRLVKEGIISKEQSDQIQTNSDTLLQQIRADQAALESARASVNADRAALDKAKLDLGYCTIRSPLDGKTGNLLIKEGNYVKSNGDTTLVVINQLSPIQVSLSLPEQQLADVRKFMAKGPLTVAAGIKGDTGSPEKGSLTFIDNTVDRTTGTIRLLANFTNVAHRLWPGQFVDVTLTLTIQTDVTVVPSEAVQTGQKGEYAFVVKADKTVEIRPVTAGSTIGREIIVQSGIQPGDTVVTDGQLRLMPGAPVQIVSSTSGSNAPVSDGGAQQ